MASSSKGPWWDLFYSNKSLFKNNRSYSNAWCNACIRAHIQRNLDADQEAFVQCLRSHTRTRDELFNVAIGLSVSRLPLSESAGPSHHLEAPEEADNLTSMADQLQNIANPPIQPISGRREQMRTHARKCQFISPDLLVQVEAKDSALSQRSQVTARAASTSSLAHPSLSSGSRQAAGAGASSQAPASGCPQSQATARPLTPTPSLKRRKTSGDLRSSSTTPGVAPAGPGFGPWTREQQDEFVSDLCNTFVACNISWNAANSAQFRLLFAKWLPGCVIPDRRILGGSVLENEAKKIEDLIITKVKGKLATGQCDGWKNVAKTPVISTMMSVENEPYLVSTQSMAGEPKTGQRLFLLICEAMKIMKEKYDVEPIGWCTDDGPDGKKARRLIREHMPYIIDTVCWTHQNNLVVGDYLTLPEYNTVILQALEVIKWFNNHGTAHNLLQLEQINTYKSSDPTFRALALILPVITRWTAHFCSVTRLIQVKLPLRACCVRHEFTLLECAGKTRDVRNKAQSILNIVNSAEFWEKLDKIRAHLEPLAIAANITQASHTRFDHVLTCLANLHYIYGSPNYEEDVRCTIRNSLEKGWGKANQDVMILAVLLNPVLGRGKCFNSQHLSRGVLLTMAKNTFRRLFQVHTTSEFDGAFRDYMMNNAEFSDSAMIVAESVREAKEENKDVNMVRLWEWVDSEQDSTKICTGRNGLARLAIRIFSVIANSAGCERIFSDFGIIHTKHRNHLSPQKVHQTALVKAYLRRSNTAAGCGPPRLKHKFGESDPSQTPTLSIPRSPSPLNGSDTTSPESDTIYDFPSHDFEDISRDLINDAIASRRDHLDDDDIDDYILNPNFTATSSLPNPQPSTSSSRLRTSNSNPMATSNHTPDPQSNRHTTKTSIPLADLFVYPTAHAQLHGGGLNFLQTFWESARHNLTQEISDYDFIATTGVEYL